MPTFGYMPAVFGGRSLPEGGEGYVKVDVKREPTQDAVMSSAGAGATAAGSDEKTAPTSSTSTAPSTSPTLAAKTTGKKSNAAAAPGSPTKTSGKQEKTSKRKNTVDNEGPNKRRTRKASQAS
ncbi:hypothetical protein FRC15_004267 [Serendipita sp. 397]|nr:hypothetical protein FRC15_004267 [Serendipita sp. 397]